jgi:outer membrane protein, multidrug efflux system
MKRISRITSGFSRVETGSFLQLGVVGLAAILITGCSMIPELDLPPLAVADTFPGSGGDAGGGSEIAWRRVFGDAKLRRLIAISLENNRDLRLAVLRVEEARSQYGIVNSALYPGVSADAGLTRTREGGKTASQWSAGIGTSSYELDFFGRVRSLSKEGLEKFFATGEAQLGARVLLVSEVATQYYTLCKTEEMLANTRATLVATEESYQLNKNIYDAGALMELDLRSSEAQVLSARTALVSYERQRAQAENGLVLLIGQPLPEKLPASRPLADASIHTVPSGLPSALLYGRPDIMEAEHTLRAANANIGAARAAFFPSIRLTGSAGIGSTELSDLFSSGGGAWSFSPQVTVPIFTGGSNQANLDVAQIRKQMEIANYEKAIQTAFREVADALVARSSYETEIVQLTALVAAQQKRYELASSRDLRGVDSYLNVISAQQDLFKAQQDLIQARYESAAARIALYKAVGGGWK